MGKKNRQSAATLVLGTALVAAAAIQRQDELSTARTKYISANQSAKAGGGSSFVAKVGREVGNTGKVYGTISDLASNLRTIDPIKAWAKCEDLVKKMKSTIDPDPKTGKAANTPTPQTVEAMNAYRNFLGLDAEGKVVGTNRYTEIAEALDVFQKRSAFTYAETFKDKAGNEHTRPVDVRDDLNAMYGFKVTAKVRLAGKATF